MSAGKWIVIAMIAYFMQAAAWAVVLAKIEKDRYSRLEWRWDDALPLGLLAALGLIVLETLVVIAIKYW